MEKITVLQFICSTGFYGAERWILALAHNNQHAHIEHQLVVSQEPGMEELELSKHFKSLGGKVHTLSLKHKFDFSAISQLSDIIRHESVDAIHTHGYKSDILGVIAAKKMGITSVCTPHGFENADDFKLRSFIWLGCQSMRFFDAVAPLSQQLCKDVAQYGVKSSKIHYIQNGVDLKEIDGIKKQAETNKTKQRIGFIGQMISRKNIHHILDIFNRLAEKRGNLELVLLGDGDQRQELEAYSKTLSQQHNIHFLGFRDDRLEQLRGFDLFVMTSTLEGIPRCLMEAMAMEIPVAAYNIAGIDQLIQHEHSGLLAPLNDQQQLETYWEQLLDNSAQAKELGSNARQYILEHFSAQRMADEYATLFSQLQTIKKAK